MMCIECEYFKYDSVRSGSKKGFCDIKLPPWLPTKEAGMIVSDRTVFSFQGCNLGVSRE